MTNRNFFFFIFFLYRLRDGEEIALDPLNYEGGIIQKPDLTIKNATSEHMGNYTCVLENTVGKGNTSDFAVVSVLCTYNIIFDIIFFS